MTLRPWCWLLCFCALLAAGCTPRFGITITNAPEVKDCVPGSVSRPCP